MKIKHVAGLELIDSRGNPTVEAVVELESGAIGRAAVPSGASTGDHEAHELRDHDDRRFDGKGVQTAVSHVNTEINTRLRGLSADNQSQLDQAMIELDGTPTKQRLGANAILAVSLAAARAAANHRHQPLYAYLADLFGRPPQAYQLPIPMMNVLNGGKHAIGSSDFQEYMIMPLGALSFAEAVRWGSEIFHQLGEILRAKGYATTVGDEGGYAPSLDTNQAPLDLIMEAIDQAGYQPGSEVAIALDPAASEFFDHGQYKLATEHRALTSDQMVELYQTWVANYPIMSIEDGLDQNDWDGFHDLTAALGSEIQIMGDDLFVTNTQRLQTGINRQAGNSILIKVNQIGTLTETLETIKLAQTNNFTAIVSHRSGETEDTFIADLVLGTGTGQIKTGSLSRSERTSKYNQLIRLEHELGSKASLARFPFTGKYRQ